MQRGLTPAAEQRAARTALFELQGVALVAYGGLGNADPAR